MSENKFKIIVEVLPALNGYKHASFLVGTTLLGRLCLRLGGIPQKYDPIGIPIGLFAQNKVIL